MGKDKGYRGPDVPISTDDWVIWGFLCTEVWALFHATLPYPLCFSSSAQDWGQSQSVLKRPALSECRLSRPLAPKGVATLLTAVNETSNIPPEDRHAGFQDSRRKTYDSRILKILHQCKGSLCRTGWVHSSSLHYACNCFSPPFLTLRLWCPSSAVVGSALGIHRVP